jgi:hypothetical protein
VHRERRRTAKLKTPGSLRASRQPMTRWPAATPARSPGSCARSTPHPGAPYREQAQGALQGVVTPVVLIYILILANRRDVLGAAANKPVTRVVATIAVAGISIMSVLLLAETILSWFGVGS